MNIGTQVICALLNNNCQNSDAGQVSYLPEYKSHRLKLNVHHKNYKNDEIAEYRHTARRLLLPH